MGRIDSRLDKVEKLTGARGGCSCARRLAAYYPDRGEVKPSNICPACGGRRVVLCVVFEPAQFQNYYEAAYE